MASCRRPRAGTAIPSPSSSPSSRPISAHSSTGSQRLAPVQSQHQLPPNSAGLLLNTTQPFEQKRRTPDCRAPVKADRPHQEDQTHDTRRTTGPHSPMLDTSDKLSFTTVIHAAEHAHHRADPVPRQTSGTRTDLFANGLTQFCATSPPGSTSTILVAATTPPVGAPHLASQAFRRPRWSSSFGCASSDEHDQPDPKVSK